MIPRYSLPEMGQIWSEQNKFQKWLDVEIAVCEVHAEMGTIPQNALNEIKQKAIFNINRITEIERTTRHDVIAFTTALAENIGPAARYVHFGLTSSDVVDTANAILLRDSVTLLLNRLKTFGNVLKKRAFEFKDTPMIGRTHGIHAEPTTFGLVLALFFSDNERNKLRLEQVKETISVGKISGAVGTFAHLDPEVEAQVCNKLGLKAAPISTQIIQRDRHAELLTILAIIAACIEKFALEIRHLQRTEVSEAQESFSKGQKGSSAMPHKRNPIVSEQLCGLARIVRSNAVAALENIALWHERDISHSSVERIIFPDSCLLIDYMLVKATELINGLVIHSKRMLENLESLKGIIFSGQLLLELSKRGISREIAYELVQKHAMNSFDNKQNFYLLVSNDADILKVLNKNELASIFDLKTQLRNVNKIFERVFDTNKE